MHDVASCYSLHLLLAAHAIPPADRLLPFIEKSNASNLRQRGAGTSFSQPHCDAQARPSSKKLKTQPPGKAPINCLLVRTASKNRPEMVWELEIKTVPEMFWEKTFGTLERLLGLPQPTIQSQGRPLHQTSCGQSKKQTFGQNFRSKLRGPNPIQFL